MLLFYTFLSPAGQFAYDSTAALRKVYFFVHMYHLKYSVIEITPWNVDSTPKITLDNKSCHVRKSQGGPTGNFKFHFFSYIFMIKLWVFFSNNFCFGRFLKPYSVSAQSYITGSNNTQYFVWWFMCWHLGNYFYKMVHKKSHKIMHNAIMGKWMWNFVQ